MGQCCASDSGKATMEGSMAPTTLAQTRGNRKLESATRAEEASLFDGGMTRDRSDTYASFEGGAPVRSGSIKRNLTISIP